MIIKLSKYLTMKKITLLILSLILLNSCAEKVSSENKAERAPGYLKKDGKIYDVNDANPENLDLWDNYIEAHNKRDIEAINQMNADSTKQFGVFKIYGPDGSVVPDKNAHKALLSSWFEQENPKWNPIFSYTMKVDSQPGSWVISGHKIDLLVNGENKTFYDIADVYIEDGKIGAFWVYRRETTTDK